MSAILDDVAAAAALAASESLSVARARIADALTLIWHAQGACDLVPAHLSGELEDKMQELTEAIDRIDEAIGEYEGVAAYGCADDGRPGSARYGYASAV